MFSVVPSFVVTAWNLGKSAWLEVRLLILFALSLLATVVLGITAFAFGVFAGGAMLWASESMMAAIWTGVGTLMMTCMAPLYIVEESRWSKRIHDRADRFMTSFLR